ncbi:hypothetical protein PsorP6_002853 [Peronosclerospora sorghi]|uniref:Uncharacterized protein n=1 Tax=Peronosclerospora sorghi TaxID=230839 RepID=A0ACC0VJH8_9STRA|nr:hypothetical protein PsorP6_002853 [Peronosclerospora sorghi]
MKVVACAATDWQQREEAFHIQLAKVRSQLREAKHGEDDDDCFKKEIGRIRVDTDETNPFGDSNLSRPFVWGKKYQGKAKPPTKEQKKSHLRRVEEIWMARNGGKYCARAADLQSALGLVREIRQRRLEITQSTYHSLAICAGKTENWDVSYDAMVMMQTSGFEPTARILNSVLTACAKGKQWEKS